MNTYADDNALPCPFCGGGAFTETYKTQDGTILWSCGCGNDDCSIDPTTQLDCLSEDDAVRVWNVRKP